MRKTILLAIIACILGIVLLAGLAFYLPGRLSLSRTAQEESELFTGFAFATESVPSPAQKAQDKDRQRASDGSFPSVSHTGAGTSADGLSDSSGMDRNPARLSASEGFPNDTLPGIASSVSVLIAAETEKEPVKEESSVLRSAKQDADSDALVPEHQIIWSGDSRTLGLRDALKKAGRLDDDLFTGRVGEGVRWFREEGMAELSDLIRDNPGLPVVLNFGVNDPQLVNEYVVAYWDVIRAHPDTRFYILSVNPLDEEFLVEDGQVNEAVFESVNSLNVARMNVKLKEEFPSRYLDSASFLKSDGFDTVDGLHFTMDTYLKIHDYVVGEIF